MACWLVFVSPADNENELCQIADEIFMKNAGMKTAAVLSAIVYKL